MTIDKSSCASGFGFVPAMPDVCISRLNTHILSKVMVFDESLVAGRITIRSARTALANPVSCTNGRACFKQALDCLGVCGRGSSRPLHSTYTIPYTVQLNYARYFIPQLFPELHGRLIYLDDDVIVRGDVKELAATALDGQPVAVSSDCSWLSHKYSLFEVRMVIG